MLVLGWEHSSCSGKACCHGMVKSQPESCKQGSDMGASGLEAELGGQVC